jgi:hypothetical protein
VEKKKGRKVHSSKNNSMEDLVGNEENGYAVPGLTKAMINVTNNLSYMHKTNNNKEKLSKRKSLRNSWRRY